MANKSKKTVKAKVNKAKEIVANYMTSERTRFSNMLGFNRERSMTEVLGYPASIDPQAFIDMYRRGDIANRIIRAYPQATWKDLPAIKDGDETDDDEKSNFTTAWEEFVKAKDVMHYMERADRLNGLGQFSLLVMGFQDGKELREPLEKPAKDSKYPLIYLAPYGEANTTISQWDNDEKSPRFGLPVMYTCQRGNYSDKKSPTKSITVHFSRVIHIAEFLDDDETYGQPRLEAIYNRLLDVQKVAGGASEAFWLMANRGLALSTKEGADLTDPDKKAMEAQAEEYQHQLRRILTLQGVDAQVLGSDTPQPEETGNFILKLIAGAAGIPMRVLTGSEQGSLASEQDEANWAARIDERRENFAAPRMLRPFVERMIFTGNISEPDGDWELGWEPGSTMSEDKKADVALKKAQAVSQYLLTPGAELVYKIPEFRADLNLDANEEIELDEFKDLPEGEEDLPNGKDEKED